MLELAQEVHCSPADQGGEAIGHGDRQNSIGGCAMSDALLSIPKTFIKQLIWEVPKGAAQCMLVYLFILVSSGSVLILEQISLSYSQILKN